MVRPMGGLGSHMVTLTQLHVLGLHAEYVFSVFKMRLNKSTDTRIQNGGEMRIHTYLLLLTY